MRPGMLLQVARVRSELDHWLKHWQTEIKAESCPRHLECAEALSSALVEKLIRVQGHETLETRAYEEKIDRMGALSRAMWAPAPGVKRARPRLTIVR